MSSADHKNLGGDVGYIAMQPAIGNTGVGMDGQYYFRSTANQRIYVKVAGAWTGDA